MLDPTEYRPLAHVPIAPGDLIRLEGDPDAFYSVILVRQDRCWARNLDTELDTVADVRLCRRIGHEAQALGA